MAEAPRARCWAGCGSCTSDENTTRAAAARAAAESIWVPGMLLPEREVSWRAEADDLIVASFAETGAVRSVSVMRWGNVGQKDFGYIPSGATIHPERRFSDCVLPSDVTVGWWFGTPRFKPFFQATILDAEPIR